MANEALLLKFLIIYTNELLLQGAISGYQGGVTLRWCDGMAEGVDIFFKKKGEIPERYLPF